MAIPDTARNAAARAVEGRGPTPRDREAEATISSVPMSEVRLATLSMP
jgi:hypothetical protein